MIRYIPRSAFSIIIDGAAYPFRPDFFDRADGLPGYRALPAGLSKSQRASFQIIEVLGDEVERATAAPGEKRNLKKR